MSAFIVATAADKLRAFDDLDPALRELIDYGPFNPDSVFIMRQMQSDLGVAETARRMRAQIAETPETWAANTAHAWKPERGSPLAGRAPNRRNAA